MIIQVVCAVIRNADDEILLTRRGPGQHLAGFWELPGGKLEPGESAAGALARELREELQLDARPGHELCRNRHREGERTIELIALACQTDTRTLRLQVHDQFVWANASRALELKLAPADVPLLKHLRQTERAPPAARQEQQP